MLSRPDLELLSRDASVPGLGLLLDDQALESWLQAPVRRRYLRYKPGTSCVLGLDVDGRRAFVLASNPDAVVKLGKTTRRAPEGAVLAQDRDRRVVAALVSADRDLPALRRLHREPDRTRLLARLLPGAVTGDADLRTLSHKPQRRWVGLATLSDGEQVVLRAHRPDDAPWRAAAAMDTGPWTPVVRGTVLRLGLVATTWLPGRTLHDVLAAGDADEADVRRTGGALADLHRRPTTGLPRRPHDGDAVAVAAGAVADLVPAAAGRAHALASRLRALLSDDAAAVAAHGDFSPDQVVLGDDGSLGFIDLDEACVAEPAVDLASATAALHVAAVRGTGPADTARWTAALLDGYGVPPPQDRLDVHLSAGLLRRAVEPFRGCERDWSAQLLQLLALAERACPTGVRA